MAEIINFSNFKKENKAGENSSNGEKINYFKLTQLLNLVAGLIANTAGNPRREAYQDKYALLSSYTDAEIVGRINNFNETEVAAKPLFYSALIDVAKKRKLFPSRFNK
ncbi:hypothetical protein HY797_01365 [Candidatus Falkowbacteria bacterium]|nr:hypothetical protein [Candidatus Falkowbacteria bacterium]